MYQKVVGITTITYIDLQPLVQKIQLIINNRPIDVGYDDDQDDIVGPNHLILDVISLPPAFQHKTDSDLNLIKRKKMLQTILNHFCSRWRREFVISLSEFQSKRNQSKISQQCKQSKRMTLL